MNATTTVSILRTADDVVDDYGDPLDNSTATASGVPFQLNEFDSHESDPTSGEPRVVRYVYGYCYPGVDVRRGDRVMDERTGALYTVDGVTRPQSPAITPGPKIELRRLGG